MVTNLILSAIILVIVLFVLYKKIKIKENLIENYCDNKIQPIQLIISNNGVKPEIVSLFDFNGNFHKQNTGNSDNIEISLSNEQTYIKLLNQIKDKKIKTCLIRIQSSNMQQLMQAFNLYYQDANGGRLSYPLITQSYFSANQFQSSIIDIPIELVIDSNLGLSVNTLGNTKWTLTIFPSILDEKESELSSVESLLILSGLIKKNIIKKEHSKFTCVYGIIKEKLKSFFTKKYK